VVPRAIVNSAPPLLLADFPDGLLYQGTDYEKVKMVSVLSIFVPNLANFFSLDLLENQ